MRRFTLEKILPLRLIFVDNDNHILDARTFKLKYNLITTVEENEHEVTAQMGQNVSLSKINFFIEHFLNNSLAIDAEHRGSIFPMFSDYENNYLVLPDMTESTLMETIHSKLNALCKLGTRVDLVGLYDSLNEVNYTFFFTEDEEYQLPEQSEWLGELSYWPDPWWHRDDPSTYDHTAANTEELKLWHEKMAESCYEQKANRAFQEIEQAVQDSFRDVMEQAGLIPKVERGQLIEVDFVNTASIPKREKWIPRII